MTIVIFSLLAVFCFLFVLNIHLKGSKKESIETILAFLILINVVLAFFLLNKWWYGFIAVFSMFFFITLFRPFVQILASKMLGHRASVNNKHTYFDNSLNESIDNGNWDEVIKILLKEGEDTNKRLLKIYNKPRIQSVLSDYNMTIDDFNNLYKDLLSVLPSLTWDILNSHIEIKEFIELRRRNATNEEIIKYFKYDKM